MTDRNEGRDGPRVPRVALIAVLAASLAAGAFLLEGRVSVNLPDEGFLWYVTARAALGDVPIRDVRAYDPGRYYWGAAWFKLLGPGIVTLRIALAAMLALGLVFGLLTLDRIVPRSWLLVILGGTLALWIHPLYKAFESTAALAFVWLGVRVIESPTRVRYFTAGIAVGLAAFARIDHGLYGATAFAALSLFLGPRARTPLLPSLGSLVGGMLVGYSPMLLMLAAIPGFPEAFVEHLAYHARIVASTGHTNLPKPVPWPWLASSDYLLVHLHLISIGVLFLMVPAVYAAGAFILLARSHDDSPPRRALLAAVFVGAMYTHYAFSRADLEHLAPSVHPMVIAGTALTLLLRPVLRAAAAAVLLSFMLAVTAMARAPQSPTFIRALAPAAFVQARVAGDLLWLSPSTARTFAAIRGATDETLRPGERILILPHFAGLYMVLERPAPIWNTYFAYPETPERQRKLIAEIQRGSVGLVLLVDSAIDGRTELRFPETHPLVQRYIEEQFEPIVVNDLPASMRMLQKRPRAHAD